MAIKKSKTAGTARKAGAASRRSVTAAKKPASVKTAVSKKAPAALRAELSALKKMVLLQKVKQELLHQQDHRLRRTGHPALQLSHRDPQTDQHHRRVHPHARRREPGVPGQRRPGLSEAPRQAHVTRRRHRRLGVQDRQDLPELRCGQGHEVEQQDQRRTALPHPEYPRFAAEDLGQRDRRGRDHQQKVGRPFGKEDKEMLEYARRTSSRWTSRTRSSCPGAGSRRSAGQRRWNSPWS